MRPIIKSKMAIFSPQGFLDGTNAPYLIDTSDIEFVLSSKCDLILISLKKIIYFNVNAINFLMDIFDGFRSKLGANVGFCDCSEKQYKSFMSLYKGDAPFCIFEDSNIASFFSKGNKIPKDDKILVWSDDPDQKNLITVELLEKGLNPVVAKDKLDFIEKKEDKETYKHVLNRVYLGFFSKTMSVYIKDNIVVYTLGEFMDSNAYDNFDLNYHQNSLAVGFTLFVFDASRVASMNIHGVNFFAKLSISAAEYGATLVIAGLNEKRMTKKFKEELEDSGIVFHKSLATLFADDELKKDAMVNSGGNVKKKGLTKKLVSTLPMFIDHTINTIETMSGCKSVKKSAEIQNFKIGKIDQFVGASIAFYGDMEGIVYLVFPIELAKKTCSLLLDEEIEVPVDIADAIGEFVNIIAGKSKTSLSKQDIDIQITLPRTFFDKEEIEAVASSKKGAQVDFDFDGHSFYFFLTA